MSTHLNLEKTCLKHFFCFSSLRSSLVLNKCYCPQSAELAKVESVVESLRNALATEQRANSEQKETLARLQEQLGQYQDKNNVSTDC